MQSLKIYLLCSAVLFFIVPQIQALSFANFIVPAIIVAWIVLEALRPIRKGGMGMTPYTLMTLVAVCYFTIVPYLFQSPALGNRYLAYLQFPFLVIAYRNLSMTDRYPLPLLLCVVPLFYSCSQTIFELTQNPWLSRAVNSRAEDRQEILSMGVGGYDYVAMWVFLGLVAAHVMFQIRGQNRPFLKFIVPAIGGAAWILVILSNFMTATFILLMGVIATIVINVKSKWGLIFSITLILVTTFVVVFPDSLLTLFDPNSMTHYRIETLLKSDNLIAGLDTLQGDRLDTRHTSFETILSHPFLGVMVTGYDPSTDDFVVIGQHSFILDTLAIYGIVPGFFFISLMFFPFVRMHRRCVYRKDRMFNIIIAGLLFAFAFLNNVTPSLGVAIGIFYPMALSYVNRPLPNAPPYRARIA